MSARAAGGWLLRAVGALVLLAAVWWNFLCMLYLWRDVHTAIKIASWFVIPLTAAVAPFYALFNGSWLPFLIVILGYPLGTVISIIGQGETRRAES